MRILVTGATGLLGSTLLLHTPALAPDVVVRATSRRDPRPPTLPPSHEWARAELIGGEGLGAALDQVDVIVHTASSAQVNTERTDVGGTRRLIDGARNAGVKHFVYVSIVGIEQVAMDYYRFKLEAERQVKSGGVPYTIVRGTQFHSFVDAMLAGLMRWPVVPVPRGWLLQPIDVRDFAAALWQVAGSAPTNATHEVAGPEVLTVDALMRARLAARHERKPVVGVPLPGSISSAMRAGALTNPARATPGTNWSDWLHARYGETGR